MTGPRSGQEPAGGSRRVGRGCLKGMRLCGVAQRDTNLRGGYPSPNPALRLRLTHAPAEARDLRRSILTSRAQVNRVQSSYGLKSRLGPAEKQAPVVFADRAVAAMKDRAPFLKVPWAHLEPREKQTKLDGPVQLHDPRKAQDPARRRRQELGRVYLYSASAWRHDFLHHRGRDDLTFPANVDRNASTRNQRIPVLRPFIKRPNAPLKPSVRHFNCGPSSRRLCYQQEPKCGT